MESFASPDITADDHVLGPAGAPVTVIEYGDYECPYCRGAARDVHRLLDLHPGMIRFVFRNFPIPQLHPHAEQAAEAAEAAAAQGKFWEMYELLLRPAAHLDVDSLLGYAERVGLDVGRFSNEVTGNVYAAKIERDVREGNQERRQRHAEVLRRRPAHRRQVPDRGSRRCGPGRGDGGLAAVSGAMIGVVIPLRRRCPDLR